MVPVPALSRPVPVRNLPPGGKDVVVEATEAERASLARELDCPAIHSLVGRFRCTPTRSGVAVDGTVEAKLARTCVVSLEPFDVAMREPVRVDFTDEGPPEPEPGVTEAETDLDAPDAIVGGRIDLGALTAEFLALGLDPHPRKPGTAFEASAAGDGEGFPFAALARLADRE